MQEVSNHSEDNEPKEKSYLRMRQICYGCGRSQQVCEQHVLNNIRRKVWDSYRGICRESLSNRNEEKKWTSHMLCHSVQDLVYEGPVVGYAEK